MVLKNPILHDELNRLVDIKAAESETLDWKASIIPLKYPKEDKAAYDKRKEDAKHRLIFSIVSFLNNKGGVIYFGIEEDGGIPTNICYLPAGINLEDEIQWIQQVIRTNIVPIPSTVHFEYNDHNGQDTLVKMVVSRGVSGPYAAKEGDHVVFYKRGVNNNQPMTWQEIHEAFTLGNERFERVKAFRDDRIRTHHSPRAFIIHVIPECTLFPGFNLNIDDISRVSFPLINFGFGPRARFTFDGYYIANFTDAELKQVANELTFFRNGQIEATSTSFFEYTSSQDYIEMRLLVSYTAEFVLKLIRVLKQMDIPPPFFFFVSLKGVDKTKLKYWLAPFGESTSEVIDRKDVICPGTILTSLDGEIGDMFDRIVEMLKHSFEVIFNSGGVSGSVWDKTDWGKIKTQVLSMLPP